MPSERIRQRGLADGREIRATLTRRTVLRGAVGAGDANADAMTDYLDFSRPAFATRPSWPPPLR